MKKSGGRTSFELTCFEFYVTPLTSSRRSKAEVLVAVQGVCSGEKERAMIGLTGQE